MKRKRSVCIVSVLLFTFLLSQPVVSETKKVIKPEDEKIVSETTEIYEAGTYFIRMDGQGNFEDDNSELVRIHVRYPKTVLNYEQDEGIDAHDVVLLPESFETMSEQDLLKSANAHAWSMDTGASLNHINVTIKKPLKHSGTIAQLEYSTDNQTSVTVNVFEQEDMHLALSEVYMNQSTVLKDSNRKLSIMILVFMLIPILLFMVIFKVVINEMGKVKKLLKVED